MTTVPELKAQISAAYDQGMNTADPTAVLALYEQLVPMLKEPAIRLSEISDPILREKTRAEIRERRRYNREHGLSRTGKPLTDAQKARLKANWTPEKREEAKRKAQERAAQLTPEQKEARTAKLRAGAQAKRDKQAAMLARLAELEAIVAGKQSTNGGTEVEQQPQGQRRGRK